jgi:hypothetical protein
LSDQERDTDLLVPPGQKPRARKNQRAREQANEKAATRAVDGSVKARILGPHAEPSQPQVIEHLFELAWHVVGGVAQSFEAPQ